MVVRALVDGCSIRAISRMTGVNKTTIIKLLLDVGARCADLLDAMIRGVAARNIEVDEVWSFIAKKQAHVSPEDEGHVGDCYTYIALDADSRLVLSHLVGRRDAADTVLFMRDLAMRVTGRPQITTDGWAPYPDAVELAFGTEVDYAVLNKSYRPSAVETKHGPPSRVEWQVKKGMKGHPVDDRVCTSHVERFNLSVRMGTRRFARACNAFSKKRENHAAAVDLFVAHYNLCRPHSSLDNLTPAVAAGVTARTWEIEDLLDWETVESSAA